MTTLGMFFMAAVVNSNLYFLCYFVCSFVCIITTMCWFVGISPLPIWFQEEEVESEDEDHWDEESEEEDSEWDEGDWDDESEEVPGECLCGARLEPSWTCSCPDRQQP